MTGAGVGETIKQWGGEKIPAEGEQKYFFLTASFIASLGETETETEQICDDLRSSGIFGLSDRIDEFCCADFFRHCLLSIGY